MDWVLILIALAWLSAAVSFTIAWLGWQRRALLLSEGLWFVLANVSAGLWTLAYGATLAVHQPEYYTPWLILRNNAASLTALLFFATVVSATRPQWRRGLYMLVAVAAALQWSAEWLAWPFWKLYAWTLGSRQVWVAILENPPWALALFGTWLPMLWFLLGLALLLRYAYPLWRAQPWWQAALSAALFAGVVSVQVWTLLPGSPLVLKVVQVLPLSMWLLSLVLSTTMLRLRFGFVGAFTPAGVLSQVREGVVVSTHDGVITWWNDAAAREFDLQPEDRGLPLRERLGQHPVMALIHRERTPKGELFTFTDSHGETRDWLVSWLPLEDAGGVELGRALIFDDLTAERAMQRTLHMRLQIQNLLRDLFALLLEDIPLEPLVRKALAHIVRPLGAFQPTQGAVYLDEDPANPGSGWKRYAWSGTLSPPPERVSYPAEAAWDENRFWAAFAHAGGEPRPVGMQTWAFPLDYEGRLLGALVLFAPAEPPVHPEIQHALQTASQILSHLVQHQRNQARLLQMQQVYASMQEAVLIHGLDGRVLDCNPAAEELLGISHNDLVGRVPVHMGLDLLEPPGETLAQVFRRASTWQGRVRLRNQRLGREQVFATSIVRIHTPYEEPQVRLVSVLRDITEEHRLHQALQEERQYFARMVEVSRMMLSAALTLDQVLHHALTITVELSRAEGGTLITLDEQGEPQTLYTPDGARHDDLDFARDVLQRGAAAHALRERRTLRITDTQQNPYWLQHPSVAQWRSALVVPLFHQDKPVGVLTLTHRQPHHFTPEHERLAGGAAELIALALHNAALYAEQFRLGQELLEAKEHAETLQRRQEQFFANLSHEMRTPLQAILGYVDVLRMEQPDWAAESDDLDAIAQAARELLDLVDQMLEFQRSRYKGQAIDIQDVALAEVVASVTSVLRPLLLRNRDDLQVRIEPPHLAMRTDPHKLRRILLNLLSNAVKFTEGGHISLDIALQSRGEEPWVRIQVADTGVGIPEDKLQVIFEAFEQAEPYRAGGTGLGLFLVRDFAQRLGGWVEVESQVGRGSVFTVWLPQVLEEPAPETQPLGE